MKCLSCGLEAGFSRLLVELDSEEAVGSLCSNCESKLSRFGDRTSGDTRPDGCTDCGRGASFALPEMRLSVDSDSDGQQFAYEYELTADTPRLCTLHFEQLLQQPRRADPFGMLEGEI